MTFRDLVAGTKSSDLVSHQIFETVPEIFNASWKDYRRWRDGIASRIDVDPSEVLIVGSAAAGFSLNPSKNLRPFDITSDIDVAVVSERYFSIAWHYLRSVDLVLGNFTQKQKYAIAEHQRRYIYWGCIATDRILSIMPFSKEWMALRSDLSNTEPTVGRDINFRIYKDFRALRSYQTLGVEKLRRQILEQLEV